MIEGHGRVWPNPTAHVLPEADAKVVFDIAKGQANERGVNRSLDHVARYMNLLGLSAVSPRPGAVVAIVHGQATPIVLAKSRKKDGEGNLQLIRALRDVGVEVHVCGQALAEHGFRLDEVAPGAQVDLAALTSLAHYQRLGYALLPD